jgi:hypothetical protein
MATRTTNGTRGPGDSGVQALAEHVVVAARRAGHAYLDSTEEAVNRLADLQVSVGQASRVDLVSDLAAVQADVSRDVGRAYVSAGRSLIG